MIYDCEIVKCIPDRYGGGDPDLEYCKGWHDHANMGISVIGVYDYLTDRYRVFLQDNLSEFIELADSRDVIIGFNSLSFDDKLCAAHFISVKTTYDLLCEVRFASGQPRQFTPGRTRKGYSLNEVAAANIEMTKSGSGALAPELWQRGRHGSVVDYALTDIQITKQLFDLAMHTGLKDPNDGRMLTLARPKGWA